MYSEKIVEANIRKMRDESGIKLVRFEPELCLEWIAHLDSLWDKEKKELLRDLNTEEIRWITNEIQLSKIDFMYWAERYCVFADEVRNIHRLGPLWESQKILMERVSALQEKAYAEVARGETTEGIRIIMHKARQLGATLISQAIVQHRCNFNGFVTALIASSDPKKTDLVYSRNKIMWENMPWWMQGGLKRQSEEFGMVWEMDSRIILQHGAQESGIGHGETWEMATCSEIASWLNPSTLSFDLFPALARSPKCFAMMESTARGVGNWWHDFTNQAREGETNFEYIFVPWYIEAKRYRKTPPEGWEPSETTTSHAAMVEVTSPMFTRGNYTVRLSREQLYWYEKERSQYYLEGKLSAFLASYCATPEESFQHSGEGAFSVEVLDAMQRSVRPPVLVGELD